MVAGNVVSTATASSTSGTAVSTPEDMVSLWPSNNNNNNYQIYIVMLYGSETWGLRENEMAVLRRTERAMVRAMCGAKLIEKKRTENLVEMLGLSKL